MNDTRALREGELAAGEAFDAWNAKAAYENVDARTEAFACFEAGFITGLRYRDEKMPRFGGSSLLWRDAEPSEAEVEAAEKTLQSELDHVRLRRGEWGELARAALEAARKASP